MRRRQVARNQRERQMQMQQQESAMEACRGSKNYADGLEDFESVLTAFTRYR
jgi:E3 ubiquitin-protein ligase RFWD2